MVVSVVATLAVAVASVEAIQVAAVVSVAAALVVAAVAAIVVVVLAAPAAASTKVASTKVEVLALVATEDLNTRIIPVFKVLL